MGSMKNDHVEILEMLEKIRAPKQSYESCKLLATELCKRIEDHMKREEAEDVPEGSQYRKLQRRHRDLRVLLECLSEMDPFCTTWAPFLSDLESLLRYHFDKEEHAGRHGTVRA